jgi:hypothetical protein
MYIWEIQNCLCLRATNWTGMEDCAHLTHFAAADDNELLVSNDDHLIVITGCE